LFGLALLLVFDTALWTAWGGGAVLYLFLSTMFGTGLHFMSGHFIAEHYTFVSGQPTYSYYGLMNFMSFNVGYHIEHHDFPFVAGSRLPLIRATAPEFYDTPMSHASWLHVLHKYITDPKLRPGSRVMT
jgi:sphingolipid delta-4 desaturase